MWKNNKECTINRINNAVANIVDKVGKHYIKEHEELIQVEKSQGFVLGKYWPKPTEVAEYYHITVKYKKIEGEMISYFNREKSTIYISDRYCDDTYISEMIIAHEL